MDINKDKIKKLYFNEKYTQVDIAKEIQVSTNYVSKVLKSDERFEREKEIRKEINKKKHNKQIQKKVEEKRRLNRTNDYLLLKSMHDQASKELSGGIKPISDRAYRNWNTSAYRYDYKTKSYILRKEINAGADVPKRVNWKNFV
jgi:predicted transcriptional regulator